MIKKLVRHQLHWIVVLLFISTVASAAVVSPVTMLSGVSNRILSYLAKHKSRLRTNTALIHNMVNRYLAPHIDLNRMSAAVVGRQYWLKSTSSQKSRFKKQFIRMVVSTYAAALSSYDDERVRFYPLRGNYANKRIIRVRSVIIRRTGQKIPISYHLIRKGNGWKIYDFSVEGVSMIQSYRAQFAGVVSQTGISGLLQRLVAHNRVTR